MSEPKIPAPLLVNLRAAAEHDATAAEADRQMKDLDAHIGELERALAAAKASHAEFGRQHTEATKHAEMHRVMVVGFCAANGMEVPELPAAPEPQPEPSVRPDRAASLPGAWLPEPPRQWEYGTCMHCEQRISRDTLPGARWSHMNGVDCLPGDPISTHAEPKVSEP